MNAARLSSDGHAVMADGLVNAPPAWTEQAACARLVAEGSAHADWWFPPGPGPGRSPWDLRDATQRARAVCDACPVQRECLDYALEHHLRDGIWAGLTYRERLALDAVGANSAA